MIYPRQTQQKTFFRTWCQRLASVILLGSILPTTTPIITRGQQTTNSPDITNTATFSYSNPSNPKFTFQGSSSQLIVAPKPLVDPLGRILGCAGAVLPNYIGFSVAIYEPLPGDPTGTELGQLAPLSTTEVPDISGNDIPGGLNPNSQNKNPYFLTNSTPLGVYNFLLDPNKGQTDKGRIYILVVNPPANTVYQQRRIKIEILERTGNNDGNVIRYLATSLDGQPISLTGQTTVQSTVVLVPNAETLGLDLLAFQLSTNLCQATQVQIIKTGDRATAEPGDIPIYRISVKNLADASLNNVVITDTLPLGFNFIAKSVRGELDGKPVTITAKRTGQTIQFNPDTALPTQKTLNIAYAVQLTNDAQRGTGLNSAIVNAVRADNQFSTKDV